MAHTDHFRRQHRELLGVAGQIAKHLTTDALAKDALEVRRLLSMLAGQLSVHLAMEDKSLYPKLTAHPDATLRATAAKYTREIGGLAATFTAYNTKWASPDDIRAAAPAFIQETQAIVAALGKRIDREDNELYPLVDRVGM